MTNKELIQEYMNAKQLAWATTTLKSEYSRLMAVEHVLDGNPGRLWKHLESMKPYARSTTWVRVVSFWDHVIELGHTKGNPYRQFKVTNARLFKNVYNPKKPEMTYEEAKRRIETIQDEAIKRRALEILGSGTRWFESSSHRDGFVLGKGSNYRAVYVPKIDGPDFQGVYQTFRRALGCIGLKPHDLRKLFLTKLVEQGADQFELMEAAGWNSMEPAKSYISVNRDKLAARIKMIQGGS